MPRFAAVDTAFLLAVAGGDEDAQSALDYLSRTRRLHPGVTESVLEQLADLREKAKDPDTRYFADLALKQLTNWLILPLETSYTSNGTSEVLAEQLIDEGLLPGASKIEADILVEAACCDCAILITLSKPLLDAANTSLLLAMLEKGLCEIILASPTDLAARLDQMAVPSKPAAE